MFMRVPLALLGALLGSSIAGCAASAGPEPGPEATSSTATAIIVVERTLGPGESIRGDANASDRMLEIPSPVSTKARMRTSS